MPDRKPALGKGLSALIPDLPDPAPSLRSSIDVDVDLLEPNDYQPRGPMHDERLEELARSIKANGVIQPIIVRRLATVACRPARGSDQRAGGAQRHWRR